MCIADVINQFLRYIFCQWWIHSDFMLTWSSGLHPLAPYFTKLVADEVSSNLRNPSSLHTMLDLSSALISNPHVNLEHYVHQLLPPVLSCLVSKSIGERNIVCMRCMRLTD